MYLATCRNALRTRHNAIDTFDFNEMRITGGVFCSTSVPALLRCPSYKVNYYVFLNGCGKKKLAFLACSVPCLHRSLVFGGQSLLLLPAEYQGKKGLC